MEFENSYFENEVRSGFFVPGMVKRSWAAQIDVLQEIDRICKKYNIQYFAEWGTLLGAIRHKGFIPWDDDMDICMKREDYTKFMQVAPMELPQGWALLNAYTDYRYTELLSRVVNGQQLDLDDENLKIHHQFPYPAGIDIFPLDYISRNSEEDDFQEQLMAIVTTVEHAYEKEDIEWGEGTELVEQIEQLCAVQFDKERPIRQQLSILLDRLMSLYTYEDADYITQMPLWKENHIYRFPKEYFDEAVYMPFENVMIPVPKYYDAILKTKYGDYMKMVKNGSSHDYPFYKNLEKELDEAIGYKFKQYVFPGIYRRENKKVNNVENRKVLFLPFKAENWDKMRPFWHKEINAENAEVIVASMPYYHCAFKGDILDICNDIDKFPKEINVVDIETIDIEEMHPDVIYIQNPCDKYDRSIIINPKYFTNKLCKYTDELVYVPWFITDDFDKSEERSYANMENYCTMPGLVYADTVYVQSQIMKETYIEKLCEWAGEDTRNYWNDKIAVNNIKQKVRTKADITIPSEWKVLMENGTKTKKVILYAVSAGSFEEYRDALISKMRNTIKIFSENKNDITVILYQDKYVEQFCREIDEELWSQYMDIVSDMMKQHIGVLYMENDNIITDDDLVVLVDAYYGDTSDLAHKLNVAGKPVMIQDVNIQ